MSRNNRAGEVLGVLDWGIGGLGVVKALRAHNVTAPIVYVSDTGVIGYGRLSASVLSARVDRVIERLIAQGATRVLIACNAASTIVDRLPTRVPTEGMITPTLRALSGTDSRTIGVIGGARTIRSGVYRRGLQRSRRTVTQRIAQPISAHIEAGTIATPLGNNDLTRILAPLRDVETLLLACTHYPAIASQIQALLPHTHLIDPALFVARQLARHALDGDGSLRAFTTGDAQAMRRSALRVWNVALTDVQAITL